MQTPDLQFGRINTDFGQGFYLSDDLAFAGRWTKERKDLSVYLNTYRLALDGLKIKRFRRDAAWYDYIYANRLVPSYRQIVLKSTKAVSALEWVEARVISPKETRQNRAILLREEQAYQAKLLRLLDRVGAVSD